ncbi:GntR family transcriptional regulator [Planosporangium sp. 12N6]|uniref:GntR family transcriptional regulator n=1 Tax=Planosporangium spinosum TaxID=3402278 RepID=UPI003CECF1D0
MTLPHETLSEKVKQAILERVIDGTYPPGTRLVELHLAREFGVSQGPVREALRELVATRLVETTPRRGTFVRVASQEDLAEVYLVRMALEETAGRYAVEALHADRSPLWQALARMRAAADQGDVRGFVRGSVAFHRAVVVATGNRLLLEIWDSLLLEVRTTATVVRGHVDLHAAAESHVPIVAAFERGDGEACARLLGDHQQQYLKLPQDETPGIVGAACGADLSRSRAGR